MPAHVTGEDGASADGSVSSGDEVLATNNDSSPVPSPKRLLANIQSLNKVNFENDRQKCEN